MWCNVVKSTQVGKMVTSDEHHDVAKPNADTSVRASISFPSALYETLELIAKQKKVSLAWVVRDAAEHYVATINSSSDKTGSHVGK
jgi:predicted DNA-binding ribbon-helix-helix protein